MWCFCKENNDYFIKNLSTGAEIYIDYYGVGIDETYPTYSIVFEGKNGKSILKTFSEYEGSSGDIDYAFEAILRDIFDSLKKGESIDFTEDF